MHGKQRHASCTSFDCTSKTTMLEIDLACRCHFLWSKNTPCVHCSEPHEGGSCCFRSRPDSALQAHMMYSTEASGDPDRSPCTVELAVALKCICVCIHWFSPWLFMKMLINPPKIIPWEAMCEKWRGFSFCSEKQAQGERQYNVSSYTKSRKPLVDGRVAFK